MILLIAYALFALFFAVNILNPELRTYEIPCELGPSQVCWYERIYIDGYKLLDVTTNVTARVCSIANGNSFNGNSFNGNFSIKIPVGLPTWIFPNEKICAGELWTRHGNILVAVTEPTLVTIWVYNIDTLAFWSTIIIWITAMIAIITMINTTIEQHIQ